MSLESWKAEYYPTEAKDAAGSDAEAVAHSLRKWRGLRLPVLKEHGLHVDDGFISDNTINTMAVTSSTCALCVRHLDDEAEFKCGDCPLAEALGGYKCDDVAQPYMVWRNSHDPEPMISALEKAAVLVASREGVAK